MIVGNTKDSEESDILILELTDEEVYVASMLLNEEIYTNNVLFFKTKEKMVIFEKKLIKHPMKTFL